MTTLPRADGLRFLRRVVFSLCVAVIVLAVLLVVALLSISSSRKEGVRLNCAQQNERHDTTIRRLDALIADIPPGSPRRIRAEEGRAGTVALIDALAPKFDCDKRADQLVN